MAILEPLEFIGYEDLMRLARADEAWLNDNIWVSEKRCVVFGFYRGYEIDLDECRTYANIVGWVHHLMSKNMWDEIHDPGLRRHAMARVIEIMCSENGLALFPSGSTSKKAMARERSRLTPGMRWQILHRDGYKCRACNATGVPLHVDHIVPVARGGLTVPDNLQTLCETCNVGKGATQP